MLFIFLTDRCCDQSTKVQSYETSSVSISCPYEPEYQNNLKYICRGNQPSACQQQAVITSDNNRNGRFRLDDEKTLRKFTVTITGLTRRDSGLYLCGIHRNTGLDVFSAAELEVKGERSVEHHLKVNHYFSQYANQSENYFLYFSK